MPYCAGNGRTELKEETGMTWYGMSLIIHSCMYPIWKRECGKAAIEEFEQGQASKLTS